ncbi:hypothetical protein ACA910_005352 [Epithemia clementina (nom. ined.)]
MEECSVRGPIDAPVLVQPVPQYSSNVKALEVLTSYSEPPRVRARPNNAAVTAIMFGDASGSGFETLQWVQDSSSVTAEHGLRTRSYGGRSSNFRELYNLVARLESLVAEEVVKSGTEIFVFTNNSTTESAFYHGTSKSKLLFDLVLRLKKLELKGKLFLHLIWVAGTCMIEQGTDGLSRGDLLTGVLAGGNMLEFAPLHLSCEAREPGILRFCTDVTRGIFSMSYIDPTGWFDISSTMSHHIWLPPPAAASIAVEKLCNFKHIHPQSAHVFVCPALMTHKWHKKLGRVADVVFMIPTVPSYGTENNMSH